MNQKTALTLLFLLSSLAGFSQTKVLCKRIDSLITATNSTPFNGVVSLTKNGKVKYSRVKGFANFETKKPLTLEDHFEMMSNTKQITAVLVLLEVEKGTIDLKTPIKSYLPELTQTWAEKVTVHHLLNHTHGITDLEKPALFPAGSDFKYGNLSYSILGEILTAVTKKPYRESAHNLFRTLKMNDTFIYAPGNHQNLVKGHLLKRKQFSVIQNSMINPQMTPADGAISTAKDVSIWNKMLHEGKILTPKSYQLMTNRSAFSQHNVFGKEKLGYGYGLRIVEDQGINYVGHTGLGDGFSSLNIYFPNKKISLVVLQNQMDDDPKLYYYFETLIKNFLIQDLKDRN